MTDIDRIKALENKVEELEKVVARHQNALKTALEMLGKQIEFNVAVQDMARELGERSRRRM